MHEAKIKWQLSVFKSYRWNFYNRLSLWKFETLMLCSSNLATETPITYIAPKNICGFEAIIAFGELICVIYGYVKIFSSNKYMKLRLNICNFLF